MNKKYIVRSLPTADADLDNLEQFIVKQCAAPLTAARQFQLLHKLFNWLEEFAELPAVHVPLSVQYGKIMRTIPFGKKMAIVYEIEGDIVYIHRIMPQSMIIF